MQKSRTAWLLTSVAGLALAFVIASSATLRASSGGFFCDYGYCYITWDCPEGYGDNWQYDGPYENGNCVVTPDYQGSNVQSVCNVQMACNDPSFDLSWEMMTGTVSWRIRGYPLEQD